MSCSRLDHLTTIRAGARTVTFCELMKKEKAERERGREKERERRRRHVLANSLFRDALLVSDRHSRWSQTAGCKGKGEKDKCWKRQIDRKREGVRDYPTGRNGRQKRKEVEWEDEKTGQRCLIPLQGFKGVRRVRRMGSLITREKGDIRTRTQKTRRNMHGHACAGSDIFSQLHCSLRLAHLHIRGSRTHYQLGEMKGARGGRRTGEEGGDQEEKGRRLMLRRAAWHNLPPSITTTMRGWNLNSLGLPAHTPS